LGLPKYDCRISHKDPASDIGKWLKKFFGLSYLESADVADCFAFDILQNAPDNEKAMEFANYVLNTYVDKRAKFHSRIWADPNLYSKRTTNGCENFHLPDIVWPRNDPCNKVILNFSHVNNLLLLRFFQWYFVHVF
jgi:hypothetical protein